jgi:hypothetical protein
MLAASDAISMEPTSVKIARVTILLKAPLQPDLVRQVLAIVNNLAKASRLQ